MKRFEELSIEMLGGIVTKKEELKSLSQVRDELEMRLLFQPLAEALVIPEERPAGFGNIVGVGIGEKVTRGTPTGRPAVKVFVKEKLSASKVAPEALVPESVGGVLTDVEAVGEIKAFPFTGRYRPAPGGVSIGNCNMVMAGTLGCLVRRLSFPWNLFPWKRWILSNNHVIALTNQGPVGVGIPQPGKFDGGVCPGDVIAKLTKWITIWFGGSSNQVDAAIAKAINPALVDKRIIRPGGVLQPLNPPEMVPVLDMKVQKSGRTTQHTKGHIDAINVTVWVNYGPPGLALFVNQFRVKGTPGPFSAPGDSGSLVTTDKGNNPVGLLFAGNASLNVTFCNRIDKVLTALNVIIVY